jgi:hypothetical protein
VIQVKYRLKQYLGLLLVVVVGLSLTACGSNKSDTVKVSCKNVDTQLVSAKASLDKATAKLVDVKDTPGEKSVKQDVTEAKATLSALNKCDHAVPAVAQKTPDMTLAGADLAKIYQGFEKGQVKIGADQIPASAHERASVAFTKKTIETRQDLMNFFKSDRKVAKQARSRVTKALRKAGVSKDEIHRALTTSDRWIWVAPTVPSQISGTTYPVNGGVIKVGEPRSVASNDAMWFYVTEDGHIVRDAAVRADCGNPEVTTITPIPPGHGAPPITCVSGCVQTPYCKMHPTAPKCLTPKDPTKDVLVNPNVPDQVKGPGTTPVGTSPGPATKPVDSSTGCNGPCPTSPQPTPTSPPTPEPVTPTPIATDPPVTGTVPPPPPPPPPGG